MFGIFKRKSIPEATLITREPKLTLNRKYQVLVDTPAKRKILPPVVILKDYCDITGHVLLRRADSEANAEVPHALKDEDTGEYLEAWVPPSSYTCLILMEDDNV